MTTISNTTIHISTHADLRIVKGCFSVVLSLVLSKFLANFTLSYYLFLFDKDLFIRSIELRFLSKLVNEQYWLSKPQICTRAIVGNI